MNRIRMALDRVKCQIFCGICNEFQGSTNVEPLKRQRDSPVSHYAFVQYAFHNVQPSSLQTAVCAVTMESTRTKSMP